MPHQVKSSSRLFLSFTLQSMGVGVGDESEHSNSDRRGNATAERKPMKDQNKTPAEPSAPALPVVAGSVPPGRDNIPPLHIRRAQHYTGTARDVQRFGEETVRAILRWHDDGAGSGSHLAEYLGLPPSNNLRQLANVLYCARHSKEVRDQLAALAE